MGIRDDLKVEHYLQGPDKLKVGETTKFGIALRNYGDQAYSGLKLVLIGFTDHPKYLKVWDNITINAHQAQFRWATVKCDSPMDMKVWAQVFKDGVSVAISPKKTLIIQEEEEESKLVLEYFDFSPKEVKYGQVISGRVRVRCYGNRTLTDSIVLQIGNVKRIRSITVESGMAKEWLFSEEITKAHFPSTGSYNVCVSLKNYGGRICQRITVREYIIEGYVKNAKTNRPIVMAKITFAGKTAYSSIDGYYKIKLDSGYSGIIRCEKEGYWPKEKVITVREGINRVDFALPPIAPVFYQLIGKVTDADTGLPIAGAQIITPYKSTTTDSNGRYALTFSEGWSGIVRCVAGGYKPQERAITLHEGENRLDFALVKGLPEYSTLEGYIKDKKTGEPINGAHVYWNNEERITGVDGYFIYDRRPVGEKGTLKVVKEGYVTFEQPLTLAKGVNQVEILLAKKEEIEVNLLPLALIGLGIGLIMLSERW